MRFASGYAKGPLESVPRWPAECGPHRALCGLIQKPPPRSLVSHYSSASGVRVPNWSGFEGEIGPWPLQYELPGNKRNGRVIHPR
jgi:hypothetical protein